MPESHFLIKLLAFLQNNSGRLLLVYVKEMKTNTSGKFPFKEIQKQDYFEVKMVLEKLVDESRSQSRSF